MSRTWHKLRDKKRGIGKEYWKSRLHRYGEALGRFTKKLTHKKERREGKLLVRNPFS
jgi:hypothetical protein